MVKKNIMYKTFEDFKNRDKGLEQEAYDIISQVSDNLYNRMMSAIKALRQQKTTHENYSKFIDNNYAVYIKDTAIIIESINEDIKDVLIELYFYDHGDNIEIKSATYNDTELYDYNKLEMYISKLLNLLIV